MRKCPPTTMVVSLPLELASWPRGIRCLHTSSSRWNISLGVELREMSVGRGMCRHRVSRAHSPRNNGVPLSQEGPQGSTLSLPGVLLIVEGVNDMRRIQKYLRVDVYVLGSATKASALETIENLKELSAKYKRLVLLLDPDVAGRQARNEIDRRIEGCWHAFISTGSATADVKKKYKDVGDIGVEHASKQDIMTAIARSRKSNPKVTRFSRDRLISMGLIAPMHQRGNDVTRRRQLTCEYLGIGHCDGKQMLKQLNAYGFLEKDLMEALQYARLSMDTSLDVAA